ncbi:MAG: DKNYY domain-containing protein [Saprospiraceae bacterium]|nr:DKNYY domain-containing protein [Saprospiraceae bacterium]
MKQKPMVSIILLLSLAALIYFLSCKSREENGAPGKLKYGFSKISDKIWYYDLFIDSLDAGSFEILDEHYCKDKNLVFYHRSYRESSDYFLSKKHSIANLSGADASSFVSLGHGYAKDRMGAWLKGESFEVSDVQSLEAIDTWFAKDKDHVYLQRKIVPNVHGNSFERINSFYAKDDRNYYYISQDPSEFAIERIGCDYSSCEILDNSYCKDDRNVFYRGKAIKGVDPGTFQMIHGPYSKDHQQVFYGHNAIANADPLTFEPFPENETSSGDTHYAKDKDHIFVNDVIFSGADASSFKILDEKYCLDKNGVYFKMKKLKGADPSSFKVYPHYIGDADAEDNKHKYGDGKVVE